MALFTLVVPPDKLSAVDALKARGYPVRWQDGEVVIETDDVTAVAEAQAFIDGYTLAALKAEVIKIATDEATARIEAVLGPIWKQLDAVASGVYLCWKAIRALQTAGDPLPEPSLSSDELAKADELQAALFFCNAIRAAAELIAADVTALTTEADVRSFNVLASPRWPHIERDYAFPAAPGAFAIGDGDVVFYHTIPAPDPFIDAQAGSWVVQGDANLIKTSVQPTWISSSEAQAGSGSPSVSVTYPTSRAAGDLAIIQLHSDNNANFSIDAGWLPVGDPTLIAGDLFGTCMWWRRLTGSESGSVQITRDATGASNTILGTMHVVRNAKSSGGYPFEGYVTVSGVSATLTGTAVTTTGPGRLVVQAWNVGDDLNLGSPSTGYTQRFQQKKNIGSGGAVAWDDRETPSATTVAAPSRSMVASHPYVAHGFAVLPVGALSHSRLPASTGTVNLTGQAATFGITP